MYGRCPIHPNATQPGHSNRCTVCINEEDVWKGAWKMYCEHTLELLPQEELQEIQASRLEVRLEETTLPSWVVAGIQQIAYDQGHSVGEAEVNNYVFEWLTVFENRQNQV